MSVASVIAAVRHAFGAPGDYGYESKQGKALFTLYRLNIPRVAEEIIAERQRQITEEGYDAEHDDFHVFHELARHAAVLTIYSSLPQLDRDHASLCGPNHYAANLLWPWEPTQFKLGDRRSDLIKAAALIVAEVERMDRLDLSQEAPSN